MGLFSFLTGGGGEVVAGALSGVGTLAKDIRSAVTGELSPEARADLEKKTLEIEAEISKAQAEINKAEAQHSSVFVAGWRPFIGWVCGMAVAWQFVASPVATWIARLLGSQVVMVGLDIGPLITLLLGMLGMATLRTVEKTQEVVDRH